MSYSETLLRERYASAGWEKTWQDVITRMFTATDGEQEALEVMLSGKFLPSSPQLWGFGSTAEQEGVPISGSSCYTLGIGDSLEEIWQASADARDVYKASGGAGFNLSSIRPRGAAIKNSPRPSPGVLPICQLLNWTTRYITAGGRSRGALMVQLDCDHPDVVEFILAKRPIKRGGEYDLPLTQCNMSVRCSSAFWDAVANNKEWPLHWGDDFVVTTWEGLKEQYQDAANCISDTEYKYFHREVITPQLNKLTGTIYAEQILDLICENAHNHADPGIVNSDIYELTNPTPQYGRRHSNPCVIGTTMVLTEYGPMQIKDVVKNFDPENPIKVISGDGTLRPLSRAFSTGVNEVIDIIFDDGSKMTTTLNHGFIVQGLGRLDAVCLSPGDEVPYQKAYLNDKDQGGLTAYLAGQHMKPEHPPWKGFVDQTPYGKKLNPKMFLLSRNEIKTMLEKLFEDDPTRLRSGSKDLLLQVQLLLSAFDTHSVVKGNELLISGETLFGGGLPKTKRVKKVIWNGKHQETFNLTEPVTHKVAYGNTITHNCSEYIAPAGGSCDLGSINLAALVTDSKMDWDELRRVTQIAVRWLNMVIDRNKHPVEYVAKRSLEMRNIGIGIMGLHDALMLTGYKYDSVEGREMASLMMAEILLAGWKESFRLGEEIEAPGWNPEAMRKIFKIYSDRAENKRKSLTNKSKRWEELSVEFNNLRDLPPAANTTITSIAPTGTISQIAGFLNGHSGVSSGCEPVFSWQVVTREDANGTVEIKHWLHDRFAEDHNDAMNISPIYHLMMLGALSAFTSMAVSKTINLPASATVQEVRDTYYYAQSLEIPGVTVYRDKSKPTQVLSVGPQIDSEAIPAGGAYRVSPNRPGVLPGRTHKVYLADVGNAYITVNTRYDAPYEIFISGLQGESRASLDAICRLISLSLRNKVPLEVVLDQLDKVDQAYLHSLPNELSRILRGYMANLTKQCFVCNEPTKHVLEGGCSKCTKCGGSAC